MNQESRATIEIIAPTVEEAVEKGLKELGVTRDMVEYEVLDEGSKGLFGLGNRQARVRLTMVTQAESRSAPPAEKETSSSSTPAQAAPEAPAEAADDEEEEDDDYYTSDDDGLDLENIQAIAKATVSELLEKMNIHRATVTTTTLPIDDAADRPGVLVEVNGNDLSILIGKQAETLNALQYITRLIVGKEIGRGINLVVDVEGYRTRREQSLRQLARRMASQAIKTGRKQMLEPMPANERRIIHIELRDNDQVETESVGEEPRRKVTIIPL
jgi:spoIIIJ-associated protein